MREGSRSARGVRRALIAAIGLIVPSVTVFGQQPDSTGRFVQITAGLGVSAHWDPTILDYINALTIPSPDQKLAGFATASEFFITPEVQVSDDWSVGLEYSYFLKSYNVSGFYQWNFSYTAQLPTLLVHYLVPGEGYWLKFGGGPGYAFGNLSSEFLQTGSTERATTNGPSFKIEAVGNTEFDEHFWGSIGVDLRWVYAGSFKVATVGSAPVPTLDFFDAGIKFGVTFQL